MDEPVQNMEAETSQGLDECQLGELHENTTENASGEISSPLQENPLSTSLENPLSTSLENPLPIARLVKVDNWGTFFLQQLHLLYLNKEDCDFTLQFHDGNKLEVHRNVLNACTEFFKNLNIDGNNVLLPVEFSFAAFNAIINFMYTGRLDYTDDICENMYSIADVLKMSVLMKLLDAQSQNQESSSGSSAVKHSEKKKTLALSNLGKKTKVIKKLSANGKKSIKLLPSNISMIPGKRLPIWKKRTVPLPVTSYFTSNGLIKRNVLDPAKPVRFEWPDNSVEPMITPDEFEDLSYDSKPLMKLDRSELQYTSAEDFDAKVNSVLKRSFTSGIDEYSEKRSRFDSPAVDLYSSEEINSMVDTDSRFSNRDCQIITTLDDDNDSSDSDNDLGEDTSLPMGSNGCDLNVTPSDAISVTPSHDASVTPSHDVSVTPSHAVSVTQSDAISFTPSHDASVTPSHALSVTSSHDVSVTPSHAISVRQSDAIQVTPIRSMPKPILKTVGTPSSSKKVRFSLEEKENAEIVEGQNFSSAGSIKTGNVTKQTSDVFNINSVVTGTITAVDKSAQKPASEKSTVSEKDASLKRRTVGAKLSVNENTIKDDKLISKISSQVTEINKTTIEQKISDTSKDVESVQVLNAEKTENVAKTLKNVNSDIEMSVNEKSLNTSKFSIKTVSNVKQVSQKVLVPGSKTVGTNHAKIVAEVLKKYPHLFNKNVRLKIMNPGGNKDSVTNIKVNCPGNQSVKSAKNVQFTIENVTKKDGSGAAEFIKNASNGPCQGPWLCTSCGTDGKPKNFESYFLYHRHLQEIHKEKIDSRVCEHCGQKSSKRNLLHYHMYTKHNIPPPRSMVFPKCDQCEYIALSESLLIKHRKSNAHHSDFECKVCQAKFKSSGALQGHMQTNLHFNEPPKVYKCPQCGQEFSRNINLKAHIRNVHTKWPKVEQVSSTDADYNNVPVEDQMREENKECTLILPSGVTLVADAQQVPLLPSSESEALNNVASGIATSIGLNDSLVNGETVILLNEGTEYFLQNSSNQGEYIVPEILSNSNQIYNFQQKNQLEQVTTIANLCSGVPTSVGQLITEDTIVTIDNSSNNYDAQYNMPISIAEKLNERDNRLILFTLSDSEHSQKLPDETAQSIIVTESSAIRSDRPTFSGETSLATKLPDTSFQGAINFQVSSHFENQNPQPVDTTREQNCESQSENLSSGSCEVGISNLSIDLDRCDPDSLVIDCADANGSVPDVKSVAHQEHNDGDVSKSTKVVANQMIELVQDWDEFSDEEREVESEDDGKSSSLPCRPTFGPTDNDLEPFS